MKYMCLYHANCLDGIFAAWVVGLFHGFDRVEFHAVKYGRPPPDVSNRSVYIVDFSYPRETLQELIASSKDLTVLDHHKSAQIELQGLPGCIFDMDHSGAVLTWLHFFPDSDIPQLLRHVEDRDLWRFDLPHTREITAALFNHEWDWTNLTYLVNSDITGLVKEGAPLIRRQERMVKKAITPDKVAFIRLDGYRVPVVNVPPDLTSDVGNALAKDYPFAVMYHDIKGLRLFSLRSSKDNPDHVDVSLIAAKLGGGGHKHSAGFSVPYDPLSIQASIFRSD